MIDFFIELLRSYFWEIDFAIGTATPVAVGFLYYRKIIDRYIWFLFWLGCALGLTWEIPMSGVTALDPANAVLGYAYVHPHFLAIIVMHTFWDGGLFLLGVLLVRLLCPAPIFAKFSAREFLVLIVWGQASELWVETTSILGQAWHFIPRSYNPALFKFMGHDVTLMPQLIWLAAPIAFYLIAVPARRKFAAPNPD